MTLAQKILAALVTAIAIFGIGFASGAWVRESIALRAQQASMQAAAAEIAKIKVQNSTVNHKIIERIKTEHVYQDCRHSPEAFQTLLEAYK